ncbi:RNA polymerase sigma factor SigZ [Arenibacter sp. N53]|uniref:RNA polymerase sigma factor SigZ n=1 Tax=Arenibacter TaxID=178469 RepID=UPI000CD3C662|nr:MULTISPECIES: RNA polymerase sigma factor SigZ [Arenibacter]MCM4151127.1 RNA polymerase sigma factor SigZ [Arenibacter sp. N53]
MADKIWRDFSWELKGFIQKKVKEESLADDILQDVFIKIINNMDKVSNSRNMRQYLFGMTRNAIVDHFRNTSFMSKVDEIAEPFSEDEIESFNRTIADCCIRPFINQLPDRYQEALLKTEFDGLSQKDLAKKLNITYSAAKSRVQRGREKLKELILQCCALQTDVYGNLSGKEHKKCKCP